MNHKMTTIPANERVIAGQRSITRNEKIYLSHNFYSNSRRMLTENSGHAQQIDGKIATGNLNATPNKESPSLKEKQTAEWR